MLPQKGIVVGCLPGYWPGGVTGSEQVGGWKVRRSLADAGHIREGVQAIVIAAVLRLCLKSASRGRRVASPAKIVVVVEEKQLVAHQSVLFQKTSSH